MLLLHGMSWYCMVCRRETGESERGRRRRKKKEEEDGGRRMEVGGKVSTLTCGARLCCACLDVKMGCTCRMYWARKGKEGKRLA